MTPLADRIAKALPVVLFAGPPPLFHHAAAPHSRLSQLSQGPPYWAYLWPGGAALIAHLAANPLLAQGKRVLDLGAGSGLVGIAAARLGAAQVTASDIDPAARAVIPLNAALNHTSVEVTGDLLAAEVPPVDLILLGDLFYAPDLAARFLGFLARVRGPIVLVGDICRADLPRDRFRSLATYPVRDVGEPATAAPHAGQVLQFLG